MQDIMVATGDGLCLDGVQHRTVSPQRNKTEYIASWSSFFVKQNEVKSLLLLLL